MFVLAGCAKNDKPPLAMDADEIRRLCVAVANNARADAPVYLRDGQERPDARLVLEWTYEGARAECELEYRIKQQEANKPF
jgi:hypothetical protein